MKRYHYIKEHLPTNKRWVRTIECYDLATFLCDLNEWNASSLTWKFWQPHNEYLMMRGIDPETLTVYKEQPISITQQRR